MISIVIPVLNEAENISNLLLHLTKNASTENISEIIIIDGGSNDGTQKAVEKFSKSTDTFIVKLFTSEKGRAKQMNAGARIAKGNILYFLHADSFPPKDFDSHIISEVEKGNLAGCFRMKFDSNHWWLKLAGWLTQFSWRACRGGDQSQFITQSLFNDIDGFDENYYIYEDNILINELYKRKQFVVIQQWLVTSARRYHQKGIWKLQYHFWAIYVKKMLGANAEDLHNYYLKYIKG